MLSEELLQRLQGVADRFEALEARLGDPAVLGDQEQYRKLAKEHSDLGPVVAAFRDYRRVQADLAENRALLQERLEDDFRSLVEAEVADLTAAAERLEQDLRLALLPRDPNDDKDVIVEIRAGTGGEEAALFAADLYRMYTRYAESQGWKVDLVSQTETDLGGCKEVIFSIQGDGAFSRMKYESGVHRVQRVPVTEAGGRIHTSTATVAVLPEAEEVDVQIPGEDLRIETQRAGGAGGQHVNKTESAVRITHLPTGIVVYCQDERSQLKNRDKAMRVLRARLFDLYQSQQQQEQAATRRSMVGTGERSEKIRTYNFGENRVTDHRIKLTLHRLEFILQGDLDELLQALIAHDQAARLATAG